MKSIYLLILPFVLILTQSGEVFSQIKLPQKQTQTQPKSTPEKTTKKEEKQEYKGPSFTLKVTATAPCKFYVDGEYKGIVSRDEIVKVELKKGEYLIKSVSTDNDADFVQEYYTVEQTGAEKFYEVDIQRVINTRLAKENADAEAQRQAQQREIEKRKREEQEAKDKVERERQFNDYLARGNENYLEKNYSQAESNYKKALEIKPDNYEAKKGMENVTYQNAMANDTEEWYNYYIKAYPSGGNINDIKKRLEKRKEENAYLRAKSSNQMDDYESYAKNYPNGKYTAEVKKTIEDSYYDWGVNSYNDKNYAQAQKQFEYYINRYPLGSHIATARDYKAKTDHKVRAANRPDKFFLDYALDRNAYIGLSLGTYNQKRAGMYFTVRMNSDLFTSNLYNSTDVPSYYLPMLTETRSGKLDGILGITYGVINPVWLYSGVGMGFYPKFQNFFYDGEIEWVRNSSEVGGYVYEYNRTKIPFLHEFGLAVSLGPINGSAGVCLRNYNEAFMMFSVGFSFNR